MNNNLNYNFDPMTGQPIQNNNSSKDNKKLVIIIVIIVIIVFCVLVYTKFMKTNEDNTLKGNSTQQSENNNNSTNNNDTNINDGKMGSFLMSIEDATTIEGKGTLVSGRIERGTIKLNEQVQIIGLDKEIITTTVIGIEKFREQLVSAEEGDNVGIYLKDITQENIERGQVLAKPSSIKASKKFDAEVYILSKEESGNKKPLLNDYSSQFFFRNTDIAGVIDLPENVEMINLGEKGIVTVELVKNIAIEVGTEFSIREGGITVGTGKVIKVY